MPKLIKVVKADNNKNKLTAVFKLDNGKEKRVSFGQLGADDYTITKDKEQRKRYRTRHKKDLDTKDPLRKGFLSFYLLWGDSTSLKENIKNYKKRFNL